MMKPANSSLRLRLMEAARQGAQAYSREYYTSFGELPCLRLGPDHTTGNVQCGKVEAAANAIKISVLYNDQSFVDIGDDKQLQIVALGENSPLWRSDGTAELEIPEDVAEKMRFAIEEMRIHLCFALAAGERTDALLSDAAPLVSAGRIVIQPQRMIMYDSGETAPDGPSLWNTIQANADSAGDCWIASGERHGKNERLVTEQAFGQSYSIENVKKAKCKIALPYIQGVTLSDYARIMDDEHDIIVEFRSAAKKLADEAMTADLLDEFIADTVNPRIARIDRTFKRIAASSRLRLAGTTVASAVVSLVSYLSVGPASGILALAGGAGAITAVKEFAERKDKLSAIKDDPLYLLWRISTGGVA